MRLEETIKQQGIVQGTLPEIDLLYLGISGLLLLVMAYIISNYVANNKKYKKALREAMNNAKELSNARSQFLANMSHEIRTPLNAIIGFSDQLGQSELRSDQKSDLRIVQKSADHLLYIINDDILDAAKVASE